MTYTAGDVTLANAALGLLAESSITSFEDPPDLAGKVAQIYPVTVRAQLGSYPWRFTMRKAALSRLTAAPVTEWTYQHQLPIGMLALRSLRTSADPRAEPLKEYEIFEDKALTHQLDLWADYQVPIAPEYWPPTFYKMVTHALAADLSVVVTGSTSLADYHARLAFGLPQERGAGGITATARRVDAQQQPPQKFTRFALLEARHGGRQ